jgi:hypothetical protein
MGIIFLTILRKFGRHWCGSGSADPYLWPTDPDPAIFVSDLRDDKKKTFLSFFLITFKSYISIIFKRQQFIKKSQNSRNQGFSYYFRVMIEKSGSGSIPSTNGCGSGTGMPKNIRIRRIRIRLPIRIRNTAKRDLVRSHTWRNGFLIPYCVWGNARIFSHSYMRKPSDKYRTLHSSLVFPLFFKSEYPNSSSIWHWVFSDWMNILTIL